MIKLMIAEDQQMFIDLLVDYFKREEDIIITGIGRNGQEILKLLEKADPPDVVLTDLDMGEMDGIELTRHLHEVYPKLPVIAMTMHEEDQLAADMIKAGAKGYVLKKGKLELLTKAVRVVKEEGLFFCDDSCEKLKKLISGNPFEITPVPPGMFSELELKIIQLTCESYTTQQMAQELHKSPRTIDNLKQSIYNKAGLSKQTELIMYAVQTGIYTPPPTLTKKRR
jgi:DNA-binding NarL/FixJ family response regulator